MSPLTSRHSPGQEFCSSIKGSGLRRRSHIWLAKFIQSKVVAQVVIIQTQMSISTPICTTILSSGKPTSVSILRRRHKKIQLEKCSEKPGDYNYSYTREPATALVF